MLEHCRHLLVLAAPFLLLHLTDLYNTGRDTYLMPVRWEDGWPVITEGDELVPYVHAVPNLPRQPRPAIPLTGNFTYQDDFDGRELAHYWEKIRTPHEQWWDLESGWLTLKARPFRLEDRRQPSFVGRRQQHLTASAATAMKYQPAQPWDEAGMTAFQNDAYNTAPGEWTLLADGVDGTILSTRVAGGFVGVMLGLFATSGAR